MWPMLRAEVLPSEHLVYRALSDGVPQSMLIDDSFPVPRTFPSERFTQKSLQMGWGVPADSKFAKFAYQLARDLRER